jgi:hypothetical protein
MTRYALPSCPAVAAKIVPVLVLLVVSFSGTAFGVQAQQATSSAAEDPIQSLAKKIEELNTTIQELRSEVSQYRQETREIREELRRTRDTAVPAISNAGQKEQTTSTDRLSQIEENQQLLADKIDEQYQTKVESASRYRMKLSGMVLFNAFANRGRVDNQDVPNIALRRGPTDTSGDFGATFRQSQLGLEVYGPAVGGARASGDLRLDFFGGFPTTPNGTTAGLIRLRTGTIRLDWPRTSIIVGQDAPFFSPLSPSSIASLGYPEFSYSGNLWTWIPQARVEHRLNLSESHRISLQGGLLDPLVGNVPYSQFYRAPQGGEKSRQPAYASRVAWMHGDSDQILTIGIGSYYSRQNYGAGRTEDAWASTADWNVPFGNHFALSGEFYRGRGLGGLGAAQDRSVLFKGLETDPLSSLVGLNVIGGWAQFTYKATSTVDFNAAYGQDNPFGRDLRYVDVATQQYPATRRNQSSMFNMIYKPRTGLLLSLEYRHLNTLTLSGGNTANHVNLGVGVLF